MLSAENSQKRVLPQALPPRAIRGAAPRNEGD